MADPLCTLTSRAADEALLGTASRVRAWLLLQQQGPWGSDALTESRLDASFTAELSARARDAGVRVVLIRSPSRGASASSRRCYLVHTGPRTRFVERRQVEDLRELLAVDLGRLRRGEPPGFGQPVSAPLYLVCTNGKHDRCCAIYGRPLVQALLASHGEAVWECSHIGGDRFAANLVCLPHGLYYGAVAPADGPRIAGLYERGIIDLAHYRGRCTQEPVVQAAEHFLRERTGLHHVDDLVVEHREAVGPADTAVRFTDRSGTRHRVHVRTAAAAEARRLTCGAAQALRPPVYRLIDLSSSATR